MWTRDVAQLEDCLLGLQKIWSLAVHKMNVVVNTRGPKLKKKKKWAVGSLIIHPGLHSKVENNLGYMKACFSNY